MKNFTASKALWGGLLASAALLVAGTAPAQAAAEERHTGNWLLLTVTRHPGDTREAFLLCDPPQGHAHAAEACAELEAVNGDIAAIAPKDVVCPMIYDPVTAQARGEWNGREVQYTETFSNDCVMAAETGSVFALDC